MTQFEYISVLISIVLALGMTEVMVCWARIIQHRERVNFSWLQGFWSVFMILLMIQFWWGFWDVRVTQAWSLFSLVLMFVQTTALVMATLVLIPGRVLAPEVDLEEYYFKNYRFFFALGFIMLVLSTVSDAVFFDEPILDGEDRVRAAGSLLLLAMIFITDRRIHYVMPVASSILFLVFLLVRQNTF